MMARSDMTPRLPIKPKLRITPPVASESDNPPWVALALAVGWVLRARGREDLDDEQQFCGELRAALQNTHRSIPLFWFCQFLPTAWNLAHRGGAPYTPSLLL